MMLNPKILIFVCILPLLLSCKSKHLSFNQLTQHLTAPSAVYFYKSDKLNYHICIPNDLEMADAEYVDSTGSEVFLNSNPKKIFKPGNYMISILKLHSKEKTEEKAWKKYTQNLKKIEHFRIYSEGLTNFLYRKSYYIHYAFTISKKNNEAISFILKDKSNTYYVISLSSITEEGEQDQMKKLLYCARSMVID